MLNRWKCKTLPVLGKEGIYLDCAIYINTFIYNSTVSLCSAAYNDTSVDGREKCFKP